MSGSTIGVVRGPALLDQPAWATQRKPYAPSSLARSAASPNRLDLDDLVPDRDLHAVADHPDPDLLALPPVPGPIGGDHDHEDHDTQQIPRKAPAKARLEARIDADLDQLIIEAAEKQGVSKTAFVADAVREAALKVIARAEVTLMAAEVFDQMMATLDTADESPELEDLAALPRRITK